MRSRVVLVFLAATLMLGAAPALATARVEEKYVVSPSGWPELARGGTFTQIDTATVDELLIVSSLVAITRNTFAPEYAVLGPFSDGLSGGAMMLYVETGSLEAVPSNDSGSDPGPTLLIQTPAVDSKSRPRLVVSETRLSLEVGDLLAPPPGTDLFLMNRNDDSTVECLMLTVFPGQVSSAQFGTSAHQMEVNLGVETVRELAPPIVNAGRLTLAPGFSISDHQTLWPRVVFVESGETTITIDGADWQIKRAGANNLDPVEAKASNTNDILNSGDAAYIPPGATVSITSGTGDPGTLLTLALGSIAGVDDIAST